MIASARIVEKGHGRIETRQVSLSRECVAHLGWPGAAQVCRIERTRETAGKLSREIAYAVTSLTPEQTTPDALLALWRAHWLIENCLHWRRDAILREDHSTLRSGSSPQAMAALRNAMLHLVKDAPGPLTQTRAVLAENRHAAIAAARQGLLWMALALPSASLALAQPPRYDPARPAMATAARTVLNVRATVDSDGPSDDETRSTSLKTKTERWQSG